MDGSLERIKKYISSHKPNVLINCTRSNKSDIKVFLKLVSAFKGKIIQFGSGAEYCKDDNIVDVDEWNWGTMPDDEYGRQKFIISALAIDYPNVIILRPFGVFGKYEDTSRRFISKAILDNMVGDPIDVYQNIKISYIFVDDLVKIVSWLIKHEPKNNIYNIGGHKTTLISIARKIGKYIVDEVGMGLEYTCDDSRIRQETKIKYTPFDKALDKLKKYYKERFY